MSTSALTERINLTDADGDTLGSVTVHDARRLTVVALKFFAEAKRREGQSRSSSGPAYVVYRAGLRSDAGRLDKLAELLEREQLLVAGSAPDPAADPLNLRPIDLTVDALFSHADASRRNSRSRKLAGTAYKQHRQAWRERADTCEAMAVALRDGTLRLTHATGGQA